MRCKLIAIVLASGYAKRLQPLILNKPKALLPVANKPMIDHLIEKLTSLSPPINRIIVSTNLRFQPLHRPPPRLLQFFLEKRAPVVALYHAKNLKEVKKGAEVKRKELNGFNPKKEPILALQNPVS